MNKDFERILYNEVNKISGDVFGDDSKPIEILAMAIQNLEYRITQLEKEKE